MTLRIYYGDGSVFEGEPADAPRLDVQAVVCPDTSSGAYQVGYLCLVEWDYYICSGEHWYGVNGEADLVDHVLHQPIAVVLKGRLIEPSRYQQILAEAMAYKRELGSESRHRTENGRR